MTQDRELDALRNKMDEAISRMDRREIVVRNEAIRAFCEILGEKNPVYFDPEAARRAGHDKIPLPPSYLLTLITPLSHDLFTTGIGPLLGSLVRGVVHTSSEVEFLRTLYCDTPYRMTLEFGGLVRKTGKMGRYLVGTFPHKVFDLEGRLMAVDRHVFFLRTA